MNRAAGRFSRAFALLGNQLALEINQVSHTFQVGALRHAQLLQQKHLCQFKLARIKEPQVLSHGLIVLPIDGLQRLPQLATFGREDGLIKLAQTVLGDLLGLVKLGPQLTDQDRVVFSNQHGAHGTGNNVIAVNKVVGPDGFWKALERQFVNPATQVVDLFQAEAQ